MRTQPIGTAFCEIVGLILLVNDLSISGLKFYWFGRVGQKAEFLI